MKNPKTVRFRVFHSYRIIPGLLSAPVIPFSIFFSPFSGLFFLHFLRFFQSCHKSRFFRGLLSILLQLRQHIIIHKLLEHKGNNDRNQCGKEIIIVQTRRIRIQYKNMNNDMKTGIYFITFICCRRYPSGSCCKEHKLRLLWSSTNKTN